METNPHKVLGIGTRASEKDIKTAYKRRLKRLREEYPEGEENEEFKQKAAEYTKAKDELFQIIKRAAETKGLSEEAYAKQKRQNRLFVVIVIVIIAAIGSIAVLGVNGIIGSGPNTNRGEVVVQVGDSKVKQGLVDGLASYVTYINYGMRLDSYEPESIEVTKNQTLTSLIVPAELIREHLEQQGTAKFSNETKTAIKNSVDAVFADTSARQTLIDMGVPRGAVQYFYELQEYLKIYRDEVVANDPVTEEDAKAYYDENESYFNLSEQKSASHILISDADHTPEKLAEAEAVLAKAKAGEDFAELAMEYSEDTGSAETGGDLGFFGETNNFVPEFGAAAWALKNEGDISDIVETEFGYHIIKLTGIQEASVTPFEDVKTDIISYLEEERTGIAAEALKNEITVTYFVYVDPDTGVPPISIDRLEASMLAAENESGDDATADDNAADEAANEEDPVTEEEDPATEEESANDE